MGLNFAPVGSFYWCFFMLDLLTSLAISTKIKGAMILIIILIQVLIAVFFIRWLITSDRGAKEPRAAIRAALGFGLLALVLTLLLGLFRSSEVTKSVMDGNADLWTIIGLSIFIGITEEVSKTIPLAIFLWKKPYFNETTDGLFYFGITGIVFGVIESIFYTLEFGSGAGIARIFITPFLHVGFAMWFGYFLARRKVLGKGTAMIWLGLLLSICLHAFYDFGIFSGNGWFILASILLGFGLNIGVFFLYRIAQRQDSKFSLSSEGKNSFCRTCGQPNPHHTLYCERCGQRT